MKEFGYGKPVCLRFEVGGKVRQGVLSIMRGDKYGHQFYWDRAAILMFQHDAGARMEKHVRPLGLGYFDEEDRLVPVLHPKEFFILSEHAPGYDYYRDLARIRKTGLETRDLDMQRPVIDLGIGSFVAQRLRQLFHQTSFLRGRRFTPLHGHSFWRVT